MKILLLKKLRTSYSLLDQGNPLNLSTPYY